MFGIQPIELLLVTAATVLLYGSRFPSVYRGLLHSLLGLRWGSRHDAQADQQVVNLIRAAFALACLGVILWRVVS